MKASALVVAFLLAGPGFAAAEGRVVAPGGSPIPGAQVCESVEGTPERCVQTDAEGLYRMEKTSRQALLVRARGYVPTTVDAAPLAAPVVLQRAAVLRVSVVDAKTGKPLPKGKVMIDAPSGQRIGDFVPFNAAGVRISTLAPGTVFVRATSPGYQPGGPLPVELVSGSERSLTVSMLKSSGPSH
jgi:hypothetical protein